MRSTVCWISEIKVPSFSIILRNKFKLIKYIMNKDKGGSYPINSRIAPKATIETLAELSPNDP